MLGFLLQCAPSSSRVPGRVGKALPWTHRLGARKELALSGSAGYCFQHLQMSKLQTRGYGTCASGWCQQPWFTLCDLRRVTQPLWAWELDMAVGCCPPSMLGLWLSNPAWLF